MPEEPWWQTLYELRYNRGWREPEGLTAGQVSFIVGALELRPEDQVLDIACGYGRHALNLLQRGFRVTGLDYGQRLVEAARAAADQAGLAGARFVWGNMLQPRLGALRDDERFDAAYLIGSSFGFFGDIENQFVLQNVAEVLRPGGRLLLDLFNPWTIRQHTGRRWESLGDGKYVLHDSWINPETSVLHFEGTYLDTFNQVEEVFPIQRIRVYTYPEIIEMLARANFKVISHFGMTDTWPSPLYGLSTANMALVAARAPGIKKAS